MSERENLLMVKTKWGGGEESNYFWNYFFCGIPVYIFSAH